MSNVKGLSIKGLNINRRRRDKMKTYRIVTTMFCAVAMIALYGCGGSSFLSESPGALEDGCQPGEIVEVNIEMESGAPSGSVIASKGDYNTVSENSDAFESEASCPEMLPVVENSTIDPLSIVVKDQAGLTLVGGPEIVTALDDCIDGNDCLVLDKNVINGADRLKGYVDCSAMDAFMTTAGATEYNVEYEIEHTLTFQSLAKSGTIGYIQIAAKETTANDAYQLASVSITPDALGEEMGFAITDEQIVSLGEIPGAVNFDDLTLLQTALMDNSFEANRMADTFFYTHVSEGTANGAVDIAFTVKKDIAQLRSGIAINEYDSVNLLSSQCLETDSGVCESDVVQATIDAW